MNLRHQLTPMDLEPRNLVTQRGSSGHNSCGFSKGFCQYSTPKLVKESKLLRDWRKSPFRDLLLIELQQVKGFNVHFL